MLVRRRMKNNPNRAERKKYKIHAFHMPYCLIQSDMPIRNPAHLKIFPIIPLRGLRTSRFTWIHFNRNRQENRFYPSILTSVAVEIIANDSLLYHFISHAEFGTDFSQIQISYPSAHVFIVPAKLFSELTLLLSLYGKINSKISYPWREFIKHLQQNVNLFFFLIF